MTSEANIRVLIADKLDAAEALMRREMYSEVPLAELVMTYAIGNGGKRFRPVLTLLASGLCQYTGEDDVLAAAFIEFIHNATLLHDDVVDESELRRGQEAANIAFGNAASVLVGDFLYTRAFQLMVRTGEFAILETMADATNQIAAGEVMQLSNVHDPDVDEARYYRVIELKTAVLFAAACQVAAQLAKVSDDMVEGLAEYGRKLGMAFQIMDDLLDYTGNSEAIGKALGDDLAEGKPTLPIIRAMSQLYDSDRARLREIIEQGDREAIDEVITLIRKTDALDYAKQAAQKLADEAIAALSPFADSEYKEALVSLCHQATLRTA